MKKEIVIGIIIIIITIVFYFVSHKFIHKKIDEISDSLSETLSLLNEDFYSKSDTNIKNINDRMEKISENWKNISNIVSLYVEHKELDNLSTSMATLYTWIRLNNLQQSIVEANKCIHLLNQMREKEKFRINNLF